MDTETKLNTDNVIIKHIYFELAIKVMRRCLDSYGNNRPRCGAIFGLSGTGKTTVIEQFVKEFNNTEDESYLLNPILVVEIPASPTIKSMASEVLLVLGDPLYDKGSEVQMTNRIIMLFKEQGIRLLIFDEMHNLVDRDLEKLNYRAANWLKRLINRSHMPTVVVGLVQTEKIFLANEQLRRRFVNPYFMPTFEWDDSEKRKILKGFLAALQQRFRFDDGLSIASDEMAYRFYYATGGLVSYIMSIIREAAEIASESYKPIICLEHLAQAYTDVVCGNYMIGINPFINNSLDDIKLALTVIEPSLVTKGALSKAKAKDGQ